MKKSGITLVEMIVAMLLSTVIISAIGIQFVAMVRFNTTLQNTINAERDAYIIANNMARILRFADPATFNFATPNILSATIKAGHLSFIPIDTLVTYGRGYVDPLNPNVFWVIRAGESAVTILSRNVSLWDATSSIYDSATRELSIVFDITKTSANGQTVTIPIRTKIKVIGDL